MSLQLGSLEEMILLMLLMKEETYGVEIAKEYKQQWNQSISLPSHPCCSQEVVKKGFGRFSPGRTHIGAGRQGKTSL